MTDSSGGELHHDNIAASGVSDFSHLNPPYETIARLTDGGLSSAEIAKRTGFSQRKVRALQDELVEAGVPIRVRRVATAAEKAERQEARKVRLAALSLEMQNRPPAPSKGSRFKGVSRSRAGWKWTAHIKVRGHTTTIGTFSTEEDAARAYDREALRYFGDAALTNRKLGLLSDG